MTIKKLGLTSLLICFLIFFQSTAEAQQLRTTFPSPLGKVFQKVGLTDAEISYYRPRVKGRKIFGTTTDHLVKYGQIWFAGANVASTLSLNTEVTILNKKVPPGKYAIYTIPEADEWTIMLYKDISLGGNVALYDEKQELIRFKAKASKSASHKESLTFTFDKVKDNTMNVTLHWSQVSVSFQLETDYQGMLLTQIESVMKNPFGIAAQNFRQSALFYLNYDQDLSKALDWINEAIKLAPNMFDYGLKADILIKQNRPEEANKAINEAHKAGGEATGRLKSIYQSTFKRQLEQKTKALKP